MSTAVRSHADVDAAYTAAQRVVETHHRIAAFLHEGLTLAEIDRFVFQTLEELGCKSCFFKYRAGGLPPFPSQACLSVNECVVQLLLRHQLCAEVRHLALTCATMLARTIWTFIDW